MILDIITSPNQLSLLYTNAVDLQFPYGYTVHVLEFTKL